MIRQFLLIVLGALLFSNCENANNSLNISFSRSNRKSSAELKIVGLEVKSKDSIFFYNRIPMRFSPKDTLKLDSLPDGIYEIKYSDLLGKDKVKHITLDNSQIVSVNIVPDSIDVTNFLDKTPIANLKDGESYTIEYSGGDIASMHGYYKAEKKKKQIYFRVINHDGWILSGPETEKIKQFEAELLAIRGHGNCGGLNSFTYKIITDKGTIKITDNTCNWNSRENIIGQILRSRSE